MHTLEVLNKDVDNKIYSFDEIRNMPGLYRPGYKDEDNDFRRAFHDDVLYYVCENTTILLVSSKNLCALRDTSTMYSSVFERVTREKAHITLYNDE